MQIRTKWLFPGSSSSIVSSRLVSSFPCLRASWNHPQDSAHLQYYHLKDMCSLKLCPPSRLFLFSHMSSRISCIDFCNRMLQIEMWPTVIHTAPTMVTDSDLQMSVGREVLVVTSISSYLLPGIHPMKACHSAWWFFGLVYHSLIMRILPLLCVMKLDSIDWNTILTIVLEGNSPCVPF